MILYTRKLLKLFQNNDIEVIALKGAHLAEAVYASPALRRMNDIDLLVKPVDLPEIERIMTKNGYVYSGNPKRDKIVRSNIGFVSDDGKSSGEIPIKDVLSCENCIMSFRTKGGFSVVAPDLGKDAQIKGVVRIEVK